MLNDEQRTHILGLRTANPDLTETQLRDALTGTEWSQDQIVLGINLYMNKAQVLTEETPSVPTTSARPPRRLLRILRRVIGIIILPFKSSGISKQ